ncbi:MAG: hypothetical protein H6Q20_2242 [Bacteroidetes bacterium]|nr:hypothetical protein [Bacteroidota bacterium]MBP1677683.1 hypothetical protein [Bacteroidota bacterium]
MNYIRKSILQGILVAFSVVGTGVSFSSCSSEELDPVSVFASETTEVQNDFDRWLEKNYVDNYNIEFKYRFEFNESDKSYNLIAADYNKSIALSKLIKFLWLETYEELCGTDFIRSYCPKVIFLIGSPAYDESGSVVLGAAEGGLKISLFNVNGINTENLNVEELNKWYFKTMHHEFGHILNQKKSYPTEFNEVSAKNYQSESWVNLTDQEALDMGFVSNYASSEASEDFVEILSIYVTNDAAYWDNLVSSASETGQQAINAKLNIVKSYCKETFGFDLDNLRRIVQRRSAEVVDLNLNLD